MEIGTGAIEKSDWIANDSENCDWFAAPPARLITIRVSNSK